MTHGIGTSTVEVTKVTVDGLWLRVDDEKLFLPYEEFPWFQGAPRNDILNVVRPSAEHLCWPALDVDLSIASIRDPDSYPKISKLP